jgi:hypothetical protein
MGTSFFLFPLLSSFFFLSTFSLKIQQQLRFYEETVGVDVVQDAE